MENQLKFLELIHKPYDLDKGSLAFLEKLTVEYPFCQTLQILMAKNLQPYDKLEFEKQVNKASAYTIDRRKFQRYISDRDREQIPSPEQSTPKEVWLLAPAIETTPPQSEKTAFVETEQKLAPQSATDESSAPGAIITEIKPEETAFSKKENTPEDKTLPETTIQEETNKELKINPKATQPAADHREENPLQEKVEEIYQEENLEIMASDQAKKTKSLVDIVKQRLREIKEKSLGRNHTTGKEEAIAPKPEKETLPIQESTKTEPQLPATKSTNDAESSPGQEQEKPLHDLTLKDQKKPDINYLIEKFLKEEPRIKVTKELPEEQEDLSAPSSHEDPQLVTETLALVYLKQGRKDKALDVYEKLCLKFPEKSSYFAKKILDINNGNNP